MLTCEPRVSTFLGKERAIYLTLRRNGRYSLYRFYRASIMNKIAKFNIGDFVVHKKHGYRAVIIDVDAIFQASGRYNPLTCESAFAKRNPWYRLLIDGRNQETYVEECLLIADLDQQTVDNPAIERYLTHRQGRYHIKRQH